MNGYQIGELTKSEEIVVLMFRLGVTADQMWKEFGCSAKTVSMGIRGERIAMQDKIHKHLYKIANRRLAAKLRRAAAKVVENNTVAQ